MKIECVSCGAVFNSIPLPWATVEKCPQCILDNALFGEVYGGGTSGDAPSLWVTFWGKRKRPSLIKALCQYRQGIAIEDMEA